MIMNIYQVTPYYLKNKGGIVTVVSTLQKTLSKYHNVHIIVTGEGCENKNNPNSDLVDNTILRVPYGGNSRLKAIIGWLFYLIPTIKKIICLTKNDDSVFHLHFASPDLHYFRIISWLTGIKYIITLHGSDVNTFDKRSVIEKFLIKFSLMGACKVCAVSRQLAHTAKLKMPWLNSNIIVVHNGIDIEEMESLISDNKHWPNNLPDYRYYLCVGNLVDVKGHDIAIQAWKNISKTQNIYLVIAGGGKNYKKYKDLIDKLGCTDKVILTGERNRREIANLLYNAEGVILPSHNEGLPIVILEAGVAGLPVIATNVGGIPEIIVQNDTGILVEANDSELITKAALELFEDKNLRRELGAKLSSRVRSRFSSKKMASSYISLYEQCLQ